VQVVDALETRLPGLLVLAPRVFGDDRGFFFESYRESLLDALGVHERFVQDNHSRSARGVVRGMHFQVGEGQAKLVRCARGEIYDVAVDIRPGSPTYGRWEAVVLSDANHRMLYVPVGFAHGFCVTSEVADVVYKCSSYYDGAIEREIAFDDPDLAIAWPDLELTVSERDRAAPRLRDLAAELPFAYSTGVGAGA